MKTDRKKAWKFDVWVLDEPMGSRILIALAA
jgi:hypothetical protein